MHKHLLKLFRAYRDTVTLLEASDPLSEEFAAYTEQYSRTSKELQILLDALPPQEFDKTLKEFDKIYFEN